MTCRSRTRLRIGHSVQGAGYGLLRAEVAGHRNRVFAELLEQGERFGVVPIGWIEGLDRPIAGGDDSVDPIARRVTVV